MGELKEYDVVVNGNKTTVLLTEEAAKQRGLKGGRKRTAIWDEQPDSPAATAADNDGEKAGEKAGDAANKARTASNKGIGVAGV